MGKLQTSLENSREHSVGGTRKQTRVERCRRARIPSRALKGRRLPSNREWGEKCLKSPNRSLRSTGQKGSKIGEKRIGYCPRRTCFNKDRQQMLHKDLSRARRSTRGNSQFLRQPSTFRRVPDGKTGREKLGVKRRARAARRESEFIRKRSKPKPA